MKAKIAIEQLKHLDDNTDVFVYETSNEKQSDLDYWPEGYKVHFALFEYNGKCDKINSANPTQVEIDTLQHYVDQLKGEPTIDMVSLTPDGKKFSVVQRNNPQPWQIKVLEEYLKTLRQQLTKNTLL